MAERNPKAIEDLYFKNGPSDSPLGKRIVANKNSSSNERVFGIELPPIDAVD